MNRTVRRAACLRQGHRHLSGLHRHSPESYLLAVVCNVLRLVPTLLAYDHMSLQGARAFHDAGAWAMVFVALGLLIGAVRLMEWLELPVLAIHANKYDK